MMNLPPGPRGTELLSGMLDWRKNGLAALEGLARRYGDIACASLFGKRLYLLSHPDLIQRVLVDNSDNYLKTKGNAAAARYFGDSMQLNNGEKARRIRRLITPAFRQIRVATAYNEVIVSSAADSISAWVPGPRPALTADLMELALRVAVRIHFGSAPGADTEQLAALFRTALGMLNGFLPPDWVPAPAGRRYREAIGALDRSVMDRIRSRRATGPVGEDLLSCLAGLELTDVEIRDELVSMMAAGYQTVGIALNQTVRLVARYPEVDSLLAAEAFGTTDASHLPYTDQVVRESLRCAPPAGALARLVAHDDTVAGWTIPAGSKVFVSSWVVHRDPRFYENPLQFKPERWTPQFERELPLCAYFPFGRGARSCVAGALSTVILRLMLATVVRRFRPFVDEQGHSRPAGEPRPFDRGDFPVSLARREV